MIEPALRGRHSPALSHPLHSYVESAIIRRPSPFPPGYLPLRGFGGTGRPAPTPFAFPFLPLAARMRVKANMGGDINRKGEGPWA